MKTSNDQGSPNFLISLSHSCRLIALCALLFGVSGTATALNLEIKPQLQVSAASTLKNNVSISTGLWVGDVNGPSLHVTSDNIVGLGMTPYQASLDVKSKGDSGLVQIWRNASGVAVATMTDDGNLIPDTPQAMANTVILSTAPLCPYGWTDMGATWGGRYLVAMPIGGTPGNTVGTALSDQENRPVGLHTHTANTPAHIHGSGVGTAATEASTNAGPGGSGAAHTYNDVQTGGAHSGYGGTYTDYEGTYPGTNAPYIQLRICKKN